MSAKAQFDRAVEIVAKLPADGPNKPDVKVKLTLYKYFKQATQGNNDTPCPGILEFAAKAKWTAWNELQGTSEEDACKEYVAILIELLEKAGDEDSKKYVAELKSLAPPEDPKEAGKGPEVPKDEPEVRVA